MKAAYAQVGEDEETEHEQVTATGVHGHTVKNAAADTTADTTAHTTHTDGDRGDGWSRRCGADSS